MAGPDKTVLLQLDLFRNELKSVVHLFSNIDKGRLYFSFHYSPRSAGRVCLRECENEFVIECSTLPFT